MFVFLIAFRARGNQSFRRDQIIDLLKNIESYLGKHSIEHKIMICEQNDEGKFNRGKLLNIAFIESEKQFQGSNTYIHMNIDYQFDVNRDFPRELLQVKGVLDLHKPSYPVLGAACVFDSDTYRTINGFPNDLLGWGGDDWAIYNRLLRKNITIYYPIHLTNTGFILENNDDKKIKDTSNNPTNMELAKRNDIETNGVTTCKYQVNSMGEFHQANIIHLVVDL